MQYHFADRIARAPASFLEELFRVSSDPTIISFAGGLPSSALIDTEGIARATREVMEEEPQVALQYTTTDGYLPLREFIADRYRHRLGVPATADEIQIVNGSQQCLDLFAKLFLNTGDHVGMERPGYLGAIEAFSLYEPVIDTVPLEEDGPDLNAFERLVKKTQVKFFYGIPNSQNPSGRTYSQEKRKAIAEILESSGTVFYEDDAFGELFFDAQPRLPVKRRVPDQAVISGSFSKTVAPGMRIGWMYAPSGILAKFNVVKQAADLHSNFLCQKILHRYLTTHDLDANIRKIVAAYGRKCRLMCELFDDLMPQLTHTRPEGGMFLMATLPAGLSSRRVFDEGVKNKVAVLPGLPFYVDGGGTDTLRLNFSSASDEQIAEGMQRLARVIASLR
ncbi:MAG: PLP-dependent aminotransferase family protein [Methanoregula sp.]|jgi:2-aminoadipate transaminase|uniref:aminotransferase-like domain-containing protein n=1 Tax=Methanoregula sp. TaxID=2052170 RepID=UPI0025DE9EBB|nr:PLP-dependent aminotransferase family protein [Methanoregula sp.]MCK9631097.1 PLP-dependent aminotransferase family protein [Methanoregula sp.]